MSPPGHVASSSGPRRPLVKGQRVVSTKVERRKIPPNVTYMPIDGVFFHYEEGTHKWKYVVKRRIVDETNIVDQYNSYPAILDLIYNAGLIRTIYEVGPFYLRLMHELIVNLSSDFNDPSADKYQKQLQFSVAFSSVCFSSA
ncbi:flocculation protein FLO11-like [Cucumis melo var. makuwa]|uniref:Flocculation protein FLO11-like n=1 Tax=Cucumis melo var. makuwa TaxID=1194695 RepID=A0A5A7V5V7_CUCMM|nr:flocculation protein FLO11-like [Cucumis melo var. makuwa]